VVADAATLEGSIDNPNKVIVEGSPARIRIILKNRDDDLEGKSTRIEYDRARDTLSLAGGAQLDESGQSVTSGTIEYKLGSRVFRTAGGERVRIVLDPKKSR
jgi:lipopolysaccharide transport protein LptA